MQPHTGAIVTVINYLMPSLKSFPESFAHRTFDVRTTIYSANGSFLFYKYHLVKTIRYNQKARVLEFEVGKDYICFLEVRHDASFENFDFIKHRHTYVREEFRLYSSSENFTGRYISEAGTSHNITGRKMTPKRLEFYDTFKDDRNPNTMLRLKYDFEIIGMTSS